MKNFPVFVFPVSLDFYINARHTHKQLLTLYNPYEFPVSFEVLCTGPTKFTVFDSLGLIAPQSCIDIVVRYILPSVTHNNTTEKFRITMYEGNTKQALGRRDVLTRMIDGEPLNSFNESHGDKFHPLTSRDSRATPVKQMEEQQLPLCNNPEHSRREQRINLVAVAVSICCIVVLALPTQPDTAVQSQLPDWLHIGSSLKLVFAFVLGLVSMLVLRP